MAQKRSSQRGVIRVASSVILAGFAAVLGAIGCSSEPAAPAESLGSRAQALTCNALTSPEVCNTDDCTAYNCKGIGGGCQLLSQKAEGETCTTTGREQGRCVTLARGKPPICCTGCLLENGRDTFSCIEKTDAKNCGIQGSICEVCAKGDACNADVCTARGQCDTQPVANDKVACQDGDGAPGSCFNGSCCAGCIDANNVCQAGTAAGVCGKSAGAVHATCKNCVDANKCDGTETCNNGVCAEQPGFVCPADSNVCHAPACDMNMSCTQTLLTGNACPDANLCNGVETCKNGACTGVGTPKSCDDKNPCTVDDCDPKTGNCSNTAVGAGESCDNGNVCDGVGICDEKGQCVVTPSVPCDTSDPCKVVTCDKSKGCVVTGFTTAACNDGDPCTTVDKCDGAGACAGGTQKNCDDGNECTVDKCTKGVGCTKTNAPNGGDCDDGNVCSTGDKCANGQCKSTSGVTCTDDTNPCTTATCNPVDNSCGNTNDDKLRCQVDKCHEITQCANGTCPAGVLIDCKDTNPCTKDDCDPLTGCTHVPDDKATCSDGNLCTEDDACVNGECVAQAVVCEAIDDCHGAGTCNKASGFCDAPRVEPGQACENDTGICNDKGKCVPDPTPGEGGAGGEPSAGGAPTTGVGGSLVGEGGEPPVVGKGGNDPGAGGDVGTEPSGGKAGKSSGGSATQEGGSPEEPVQVFVRDPGGCSCTVPQSVPSRFAWLGGVALVGALARRRRARVGGERKAARIS